MNKYLLSLLTVVSIANAMDDQASSASSSSSGLPKDHLLDELVKKRMVPVLAELCAIGALNKEKGDHLFCVTEDDFFDGAYAFDPENPRLRMVFYHPCGSRGMLFSSLVPKADRTYFRVWQHMSFKKSLRLPSAREMDLALKAIKENKATFMDDCGIFSQWIGDAQKGYQPLIHDYFQKKLWALNFSTEIQQVDFLKVDFLRGWRHPSEEQSLEERWLEERFNPLS